MYVNWKIVNLEKYFHQRKNFKENDTLLNFSLGKISSGANQNK
jgi:hypothetical protein